MCFMDDATTPPLKNMLGRFKFNAQHAKLNAIFATLQVPLCPLFCIVIITAWWRLGEWEFQRYLITEWRSEPKTLVLWVHALGEYVAPTGMFFCPFCVLNRLLVQSSYNTTSWKWNGIKFFFSVPFLEHVHDFVLFALQITHLDILDYCIIPHQKTLLTKPEIPSESVFNDHLFAVLRTEPVNCMKVVGPTCSSLTTVTTYWWKTPTFWDPKTRKKHPAEKKSVILLSFKVAFTDVRWSFTDVFGIRCGGLKVAPRLEILGGPSPKSMGKSTDPCWQKSEGHEENKATYFVNIHPRSLT